MQHMRFRGFKLHFENRDAAESMVRQIDEFPSFFTPSTDRPTIIDCGANIGVSVLEWKTRWPGSRITCFEPDPFAFKVLQKNIDANDIPGVRCINAAVSDADGQVPFYGDIGRQGDARGNSLDPAWGQRENSVETIVKCQRLSRFMGEVEISFLKIDIEGAEKRVLREITPQLRRVAAIYVEVHETRESIGYNSAAAIEQILINSGFTLEGESRHGEHALPSKLNGWQTSVGARQVQLLAWR